MTVGLGVSIGTVNTVCAVESRHHLTHRPAKPQVPITWRTTLTFDSNGTARVGRIPKHGRALSEFADLTQRGAPTARVGHRALAPADLVATVAQTVATEALGRTPDADVAVAVSHPAGYPRGRVAELRVALNAVGLTHAALVTEPVAAAAWLESVRGPLMPGLVLVYDLGGSGLRVTLVRVGAGCPDDPVVGEPLHSSDFGGRAFGALVARKGERAVKMSRRLTDAEVGELRTAHIRGSLALVYRCLRIADVTMADVDRVLVVGGAARPNEVSALLAAELARPVIVAPDPERTIAEGAAILACRSVAVPEPAVPRRRVVRLGAMRRRLLRAAVLAGVATVGGLLVAFLPAEGAVTGSDVQGPAISVAK